MSIHKLKHMVMWRYVYIYIYIYIYTYSHMSLYYVQFIVVHMCDVSFLL